MALAVVCLVGAGAWLVTNILGKAEENRFAKARQEYDSHNFVESAKQFRALEKDYPSSNRLAEYRFFAAMSEVRQPAYTQVSLAQTRSGYEKFHHFLERHRSNELLKKSPEDVRDTLYKFVAQLTEWAEQKPNPDLVATARQALEKARQYADGKDKPKDHELAVRLDAVVGRLQTEERRQRLLRQLRELVRKPSGDAYQQARDLIRTAAGDHPELANDGDVLNRLDQLVEAHRKKVGYRPVERTPAFRAPAEDTEPSLLVAPPVGGQGLKRWPRQSPVLALARGVLYALRPSNGAVLWATRVGIDTTALPVRLPAGAATPELILVASSDARMLSALAAGDGRALWHHRLSGPCLGRPTVVWEGREHRRARRIFVAADDGRVDEIDPATGRLTGYYPLGQPVNHGGVYDEDSGLLYLAADSSCVFVLNPAHHTCERILYTGHPSGTLRGDPVIVRGPDARYLLLCLADGFEATELRLFPLPITRPDAASLRLNLRVPGWSWFAPRQDTEKLALATDMGAVGVFGIRQPGDRDPLLYPMLGKELRLSGARGTGGTPAARAQVVYLDGSNLWVLAHGELHRLRLGLGPDGWKITELWNNPVALGAPLHAGQVDPAHKLLFFAAQPGAAQTCLASAVRMEAEADDGDQVPWATLLGMVGQGDPVVLNDTVLIQDPRGGLFRFDSGKYKDTDVAWHIHERLAARPLVDEGSRAVHLVAVPGGALALVGTGKEAPERLVIRRLDAATGKVTDEACPLTAPLAGTPGTWADHLVLPLGSGVLVRKDLGGADPLAGLDWRAEQADENAPGHVVRLSATDFLVTDGSRGLVRMSWPKNGDCRKTGSTELAARIVAAPLVRFTGPNEFRVYVADADNQLTLLRGDLTSDRLEVVRRLPLDGTITAGPFDLGKGVGCTLDRRRLVLVDPAENKPLWSYNADAPLVGRPALVGGLLIVADSEGRFVGLDPAGGEPRGKGYRLRANVAPACTPVAFGADRLFAPLTDGTVLLLSLKRLQAAPPRKVPLPERFF
jgi:outer membrane protein assembly factor BamB